MPILGNALDFAQLEAKSIRIHQLGLAPTSPTPVKGQMYFNTADNTLYWYDGTTWQTAKGGPSAPNGPAGGDLTGTYPNPTVTALAITDAKVATANKDGAAATPSMRTLGVGAAQAAAGNDARFGAASPPNGAAGGDLSGTYPNPGIASGVIVDGDVNAAAAIVESKLSLATDAVAGTGSRRTLGTGAQQAAPGNHTLVSHPTPVVALPMGNQKITGLADGTAASDAATKGQVDSATQGLDAKGSVLVAYNGNVALTGAAVSEGSITPANGDRVLCMGQTTASQNGIYVVNTAGAWTRATDADTWTELVSAYTFVEQGNNADNGYVCTVDAGGTLGTTAVAWVQFSGAGQVIAGAGLTKTGNSLDVGAGTGISVAADTVGLAIPVIISSGGTSATTASQARINLGVPGVYATAVHGAGTTWSITAATHGCGPNPLVQVTDVATGNVELPDVNITVTGTVAITYGASVSANSKRVTIIG